MTMRFLRGVALLAALFSATPVLALDNGCLLDHCEDKAPPTAAAPPSDAAPTQRMTRPRFGPSASASGEFDFYVLALSWSPGFCELSGGGRSQCEPGARLGFVVHGLWPQYEHGFPSNCGGSPTVSRMALDRAKGVYPDDGLARYEWRKHGTCTGLSPGDYFDSVARAKSLVTIPQNFQNFSADQTFATQDVERAFIEANPRLRPGMMSVGCQRGLLQEVRICVTKDLRDFRACPEVARGGCHSREIRATAPY